MSTWRKYEREDGLVRDPYANRLAGDRGHAILNSLTGAQLLCLGMAIRTRFLDELLIHTIAEHGIRTVINAGAGLDTRPFRLDLPADLRWIEADLPDIIAYKTAAMGADRPQCRLERIAADLTDARQRGELFAAAGGKPALMITEGLLMYLPAGTVEALAAETPARHWLLDASALDMGRLMGLDSQRSIDNVRAPGHLAGAEVLKAVGRHGWSVLRHRGYARDSREIAAARIRTLSAAITAAGIVPPEPPPDDPSGVYLFGRVA